MNRIRTRLVSALFGLALLTVTTVPSQAGSRLFPKKEILTDLKGYGESAQMAGPLSKEGVFIQPMTKWDEIYDLYREFRDNYQPLFITSDLLFHTVHKLFDYSLRVIELEQLPLLQAFSREMYAAAQKLGETYENDQKLGVPIKQLMAYLAVSNLLLGNDIDMDASLREQVLEEIKLIQAHGGFHFSRILNQKEDYSQYAVRGHYTRNDSLKRYFLATMWYGRRMFRFDETKPDGAGTPIDRPSIKGWWRKTKPAEFPEIGYSEIRSACLLAFLLHKSSIQGQPALKVYERLRAPFDDMVGLSEDITVEVLSAALEKMFQRDWTPVHLKNDQKIYELAKGIAQGNRVRIDATGMGRKGLTLLGQRFILDAAFFQKLVHDKRNPLPYEQKGEEGEKPFTWARDAYDGEVRGFPRGLDLMAVLGSQTASEILKNLGDADYENYFKNMDMLRKEFEDLKPSEHVYEELLRSLTPLFRVEEQAPDFMKSPTWRRKSLNTALGAWTELRHDTVLYGKQSYTSVPRGAMGGRLKLAYVEPSPEVYLRLSAILDRLKRLEGVYLPEMLTARYGFLADVLNRLAKISEKELEGALPDTKEADFLLKLADMLKSELEFPGEMAEKILGETDSKMPLAVDIHTRMPEALTEALGFPAKIVVVIPVENKPRLFFGGVYSYYEFKVPYENRLTDETWIDELKTGKTGHRPLLF